MQRNTKKELVNIENQNSTLVSIIIPTQNRTQKLRDALESVAAQSHCNLEIVIIDDSSELSTQPCISASDAEQFHARTAIPIKVIKNPDTIGASASRNKGIQAAQGKYIAFLDDDDLWLPEKIEKQLIAWRTYPEASVISCNYFVSTDGITTGEVRLSENNGDHIKKRLLMSNVLGTCSVCMARTDFLKQLGGFDPSFPSCQDWELWIRLTQNFGPAFIVDETLAIHRNDRSPRISTNTKKRIRGYFMLVRKHRSLFPAPIVLFHLFRILQTSLMRFPFLYSLSRHIGKCIRFALGTLTGYRYHNTEVPLNDRGKDH